MNINRLFSLIELYNNLGLECIVDMYKKDNDVYWTSRKSAIKNKLDIKEDKEIKINIPIIKHRYILNETGEELRYKDTTIKNVLELYKFGAVSIVPIVKGYKELNIYEINKISNNKYEIDLDKILKATKMNNIEDLMNRVCLKNDTDSIIVRNILKEMVTKRKNYNKFSEHINETNINYICESLIIALDFIDKVSNRHKIIDLKFEYMNEKIDKLLCGIESMEVRKLINDGS